MRIPMLIVAAGLVAAAATAVALASGSGLPNIGSPKMTAEPVYRGYYDKHIDTYMLTDVSNKAQATAMHINYSAALGKIKSLPLQYFVKGRAAKGQLTDLRLGAGRVELQPAVGRGLGHVEDRREACSPRPRRPDQHPRLEGQADREGRAHRPQRADFHDGEVATRPCRP